MELPQRPDLTDIIKEEKSPDRKVALSVLWYFCGFFAVVSLYLYKANNGLNSAASDNCSEALKASEERRLVIYHWGMGRDSAANHYAAIIDSVNRNDLVIARQQHELDKESIRRSDSLLKRANKIH